MSDEMGLTFHEFKNGMTVMDGKQCVAVARPTQSYGWILRIHNGSWTDPRARTQGLLPGKYPYLLNIRTRPSTRAMMKGLTLGSIVPNPPLNNDTTHGGDNERDQHAEQI